MFDKLAKIGALLPKIRLASAVMIVTLALFAVALYTAYENRESIYRTIKGSDSEQRQRDNHYRAGEPDLWEEGANLGKLVEHRGPWSSAYLGRTCPLEVLGRLLGNVTKEDVNGQS
jgi:hypothetical protein